MSDTTNAAPNVRLGGRYDLLAKLGEGGMGVVHRAWDNNLQTEVVIKIPLPGADGGKAFADRFAREVQSLVRLRHPHVVGILDYGEHLGTPFAVLQYLPGGSLKGRGAKDFAGRPVPAPPASLRGWLAEIAAALDFVHAQGFIHRDVKPDNILFDAHGHVYLSDFGIAKVLAALASDRTAPHLTKTGAMIGTPAYMAPEQVDAMRCDGRADQYALGVTVYEQLAGKNPFADLNFSQLLRTKVGNEVQPLHAVIPSTPKAVSAVLQRAMSAEPAARYPSCGEFAKALLAACGAPPAPPPRPAPAPAPPPAPLSCPGCGSAIPLTPALFGKRVKCFKCSREHTVSPDGRRFVPVPPAPPGPAPAPPRPAPQPRPALPALPADTRPISHDHTNPQPPTRRRSKPLLLALIAVLAALAIGLAVYRFWPGADRVTRDDVVTGTIDIDFRSRRDGPQYEDAYTVDLAVRTGPDFQVLYRGTIHRRPPTKDKPPSPGLLKFNLTLTEQRGAAGRPSDAKERTLGKITGVAPQSTDGLYTFDELKWTNELGVTVGFAGKVQGKLGDRAKKAATEVQVFVGAERMTYLVADSDPMKFRGLVIPEDTGLSLPATEVGGDLTFDYEKGSYLPNDLTFTSGKTADRVSGIIDWHKNPSEYLQGFKVGDTATNARSQYRFNLVFAPASESGTTSGRVGKGEESRLAVTDKKMSTLTGSIDYVDEGPVRKDDADPEPSVLPHKSRLTFRLNANRLTARQVHAFLKMWLLMSGPVNDE